MQKYVCVCVARRREPKSSRSMVWVGSHNLENGAVRYMGILHVISHKEYKAMSNGYENDIALIQLKKKLSFSQNVSPVKLPSVDDTFDSSSECWITGWGNVGNGKFCT